MKNISSKVFLMVSLLVPSAVSAQGLVLKYKNGTSQVVNQSELEHIQVFDILDEEPEKPLSQPSTTFDITNFKVGGERPIKFDEASGVFTFRLPYGVDVKSLTADYVISPFSRVSVNGVDQVNGATANDYSMPLTFVVTEPDGTEHSYIAAICWSDLPVLYIDTHEMPIDSREEYVEQIEMTLVNSAHDALYSEVRMKGRGNSSWYFPKKSYTVKLPAKDSFAGMKKHKTWALVSNYADKTLLRNVCAYDMANRIFTRMAWNPHTVNVNVVLNGDHLGVYALTESVKIDGNRVDIPSIEKCKDIAEAGNYGFLLEFDMRQDEVFTFQTCWNDRWISLKDPSGDDVSDEIKEYIVDKTYTAEQALMEIANGDFESYAGLLDIDSFIDWALLNEMVKNVDSNLETSCFMYYKPETGKFYMGPAWDFDLAFGNVNYSTARYYEGYRAFVEKTWLFEMLKDPTFVTRLKARWEEVRVPVLEYLSTTLAEKAGELQGDIDYNFSRWPILGEYVWPNPDGYEERQTYASEVDFLLDWTRRRIDWLDGAIREMVVPEGPEVEPEEPETESETPAEVSAEVQS